MSQNKTAIDYYPFNNTFGKEKKKKKWKLRRSGCNIGCRDSFDDKLPRLTREYNKNGDEQELVIYRDAPYDINSLIAVLSIIKNYKPDIVVFDFGRLPFFDKYIEKRFSFSNIVMPFKKIFAMIAPFKAAQIGIGKIFHGMSKKFYQKTEISSYGFEAALDFIARKYKVPIIAGDLHHKITDTLRVFNDYLDLYNIATLLHYGIIDNKFIKTATRTQLGDNLGNIIQMRLYPHMTAMNVYRNDILSCVLNEINPNEFNKILLISQPMRLKDLYDKLCGKSIIKQWIKTIENNQHILMNKWNLFEYKHGMTNDKNTFLQNIIQSEYDDDIAKCISYLGYQQTAFLLLKYPLNNLFEDNNNKLINMSSDDLNEQEFVDKLKEKITEIAQELKKKYH